MGTNNIDYPSSNAQTRTVSQRFIHPSYDNGLNFAAALLKLSTPFTITNYVRTACVPNAQMDFAVGKTCTAAGWGSRNEYDPYVNPILYEVNVDITSRSTCDLIYDGIVTDNMVCAGGVGGEGICHGDSPLVTKVDSKWYVVGIPLASYGCAREGYPAIYQYAPVLYDWIEPIFRGEDPPLPPTPAPPVSTAVKEHGPD
ncbi:prostasin-like [Amphiura filiformis]|uniref:prostasin-like n=1 Tax=Amphiura filiformis TaxID=82378 RepID=UPI003B2268F9